jgi:proton glutamate symport protein
MKKLTLTRQILLGLVLGIAVGWLAGPEHAPVFRPFSQIFLRLVKMLIAPLIFATLVAGIAGGGHVKVVGRMAVRAFIYFEVVTTLAIAIGLAMVNLTQPGAGVVLPPQPPQLKLAAPQTWQDFVLHIFPESVIKAMAEGDVLQIVVFSMLFAFALNLLGERGRPVVALCEAIAETMFKFTNIVMRYAPIGVACATKMAASGM